MNIGIRKFYETDGEGGSIDWYRAYQDLGKQFNDLNRQFNELKNKYTPSEEQIKEDADREYPDLDSSPFYAIARKEQLLKRAAYIKAATKYSK